MKTKQKFLKQLGNRIRTWRMELGYTYDDAAVLTGLSRAGICLIENGMRDPKANAIKALASAMGCTIDELMKD